VDTRAVTAYPLRLTKGGRIEAAAISKADFLKARHSLAFGSTAFIFQHVLEGHLLQEFAKWFPRRLNLVDIRAVTADPLRLPHGGHRPGRIRGHPLLQGRYFAGLALPRHSTHGLQSLIQPRRTPFYRFFTKWFQRRSMVVDTRDVTAYPLRLIKGGCIEAVPISKADFLQARHSLAFRSTALKL